VIFLWGLWVFVGGVLIWNDRERRGLAFSLGVVLAVVSIPAFALAGIDNSKSGRTDCRQVFDPNTGGDVLSCRTEHWLPPGLWRVINRF
jgi:hypothetical protein